MRTSVRNSHRLLGLILLGLLFSTTALGYREPDPAMAPTPDLDVRDAGGPVATALPPALAPAPRSAEQRAALDALRARVPNLTVRWSARTGSPSRLYSIGGALTEPSDARARQIALDFLVRHRDLFGLSERDIGELRFTRSFATTHNGARHFTIQQQVDGIDVFGGSVRINLDRSGRVLNVSGEPYSDIHDRANTAVPTITAADAARRAAAGARIENPVDSPQGVLKYFPLGAGPLRLAWEVTLADPASPNVYRSLVDAVDGTVLWRQNLTRYNDVPAHGLVFTSDSPHPDTPTSTIDGDVCSNDDSQTCSVDADCSGSNICLELRDDKPFNGLEFFPHDDPHADWWNGSGQPDRTTTISNNVQAQEDRNADNTGGFRPTSGAGEDYSYTVDFSVDPSTEDGTTQNQSSAIANLFYWSNRIHDIYYRLGFDEAAGNFQETNFVKVCSNDDTVVCDEDADCGGGNTCDVLPNGGDRVIADAQDGRDKMVCSNDGSLCTMDSDCGAGNTCDPDPSLCNANFNTPADGTSPRMQMFQCNNATPERDGSFENLIVIHEYTHGLSRRLIDDLMNSQGGGMGEGWSDFFGLAITSEADDDLTLSYPRGQWFYNNVGGNRSSPYSTDQSVYPRTYADINDVANCDVKTCSNDPTMSCSANSDCGGGNTCDTLSCSFQTDCEPPATSISQGPCKAGVHRTGEVWANSLWMARANLVWKLGFAAGGDEILQLVVDGMKLSPDDPDFLDARDAVLQADDINNGGAFQCLLWDAFARMGLGFSALSTGSGDINPLEAFDLPPTCVPDIELNAPLDFGNVCIGDFGTNQLRIFNTGVGDLIVSDVARVGGSDDITVDPNPEVPVFVGPGSHVDFTVRCTPTSFGAKTATIQIDSNDPDEPTIQLEYTCNAPSGDIEVTGSTEFGDVCAGTQAENEISVCNTGLCNLTIDDAFLSAVGNPGASCDDFEIVNNPFPDVISKDFCIPLTVRFTPTTAGPKSCDLNVESDDPDEDPVVLTLTANTPFNSIAVAGDQTFPPEVIQSVGACSTALPFPVVNTGVCPAEVSDVSISVNPDEYGLGGLPPTPLLLQPGEQVGDGALSVIFAPQIPDRDILGQAEVTWVLDPITGQSQMTTAELCGEGVFSGARVLVTAAGVPLDLVKSIKLQRIGANRNKNRLDTLDNARDVPLTQVVPESPCGPFQYHREYGTVSNPIQLAAGAYQVSVQARVNGRMLKKTVGFDVQTCDFNPTIVVDF